MKNIFEEMDKNNYIWITWEIQRRNRSLSAALSARLVEITDDSSRIIRYLKSSFRTITALRKHKPEIFFVQNPSIVLATLALSYHMFTRTPLVVDAHNSGLFPAEGRSSLLNMLAKFIVRHTPVTIVTNSSLRDYVESIGGCAAVLPDPLPRIDCVTDMNWDNDSFNVMFICTWAADEPFMEVINAARTLPEDIRIYITGKSKKNNLPSHPPLPKNVILTGFINDEKFTSMLCNCDLVIDLTTRQDCLVCGAYEAISADQPSLLSDTPALREYFGKGALYTHNTADDIAKNILYARKNIDVLNRDVLEEKTRITMRWNAMMEEFKHLLHERFSRRADRKL